MKNTRRRYFMMPTPSFQKRLKCCVDQLKPPPLPTFVALAAKVRFAPKGTPGAALPDEMADCSLASLQTRLNKSGGGSFDMLGLLLSNSPKSRSPALCSSTSWRRSIACVHRRFKHDGVSSKTSKKAVQQVCPNGRSAVRTPRSLRKTDTRTTALRA